ncbi:MAG: ABC transporter ATP-binding protein, partial [Deltaproteobacteria bacterium]
MMKKKSLLSCRNLGFSYQKKKILENICLNFYPGEFVALLGRNGAGKSTLLSCLSGLLTAEFDYLTIEEVDLSTAGRREVARRLSYVPQEHEDMFPFSV